jgi:hypothetical protein
VSPRWLAESRKAGMFLDPWTFILRDEINEKKWGFKLETTLHQVNIKACVMKTPGPEIVILGGGGGLFIKGQFMPCNALMNSVSVKIPVL